MLQAVYLSPQFKPLMMPTVLLPLVEHLVQSWPTRSEVWTGIAEEDVASFSLRILRSWALTLPVNSRLSIYIVFNDSYL